MMFLNSSGIISILNRLDFKKLANFLSRKSLQTFFCSSRISARYIPNYFVLLGACFRTCSPICLFIGEKSNKIYNQIPKQAKQQGHWNGRKWLKERVNCWLLIHDATWEGNGYAEVYYCVVSMNICCVKLTENFGLNQALLSPLVVI